MYTITYSRGHLGSIFVAFLLVTLLSHDVAYAVADIGEGGIIEESVVEFNEPQPNEEVPQTFSLRMSGPQSGLNPFEVFTLKGNYIASGVGLRGRSSATITIPPLQGTAVVKKAYLYWSFLDNIIRDSEKVILLNGTPVSGNVIGSGPDTCWGLRASRAFRADVTHLVSGEGTYTLSGITTTLPLLAQGASLVIIYEDGGSLTRTIVLKDGNEVLNSAKPSITTVIQGFDAHDYGIGIDAKTTFIVGGGRAFTDTSTFFAGHNTFSVSDTLDGSEGDFWDNDTYVVSPYMREDDTSAQVRIRRGDECVNWVAQVFSVTADDGTIPQDIVFLQTEKTEDDGVQDAKGVADETRFTFSTKTSGEPDRVVLVVDEVSYDATRTGDTWSIARTFPKGVHTWYFRATKGTKIIESSPSDITTGYSNVAFLPGIQASRLYREETFENQLWEPNTNGDVEKLYMDEDGNSKNGNIYTKEGGVIDEADIIPDGWTGSFQANVYKKFIDYMDDEMVGNEVIHAWKPLAYDWRLDFDALLASGAVQGDKIYYTGYEEQNPYILSEIEALAQSSDTGKVTLVAHSMGGLVAKKLLEDVKDENHPYHDLSTKIDKLILVASPQLGTPKALEAMLHADRQQYGVGEWGVILDEERARASSENMQSAYNLLPSPAYYDRVSTPVITFHNSWWDGIKYIDALKARAGTEINSYDEMYKFLLGDNGKRTEPSDDNEEYPNVLNRALLDTAKELHEDEIDTWAPPVGVEVYQIAGWGEKTIKGIEYSCPVLTCNIDINALNRELKWTKEGDGTVVVPSAVVEDAEGTYYVNLKDYNRWYQIGNRSHADILEIESAQDIIDAIIRNESELPYDFISETKPTDTDEEYELVLRSPVSIDVYDQSGKHTGIVPSPKGSDLRFYEARIPNSYYVESAGHKYVGFGREGIHVIKLSGEDLGSFTLDIRTTQNDTVVEEHQFLDLPVTAKTKGKITLGGNGVPTMVLDVDGNGIDDMTVSGDTPKPIASLGVLRYVILSLNIEKGIKTSLAQKVANASNALQRNQSVTAKNVLSALKNEMNAQSGKKIDQDSVKKLVLIVDKIVFSIEN